MRYTLAILALLASALQAQAMVPCREPDVPACATKPGRFQPKSAYEACKREMEAYKIDVETFVACLKEASDATISEYNATVDAFNRKVGN